MGGCDRKATRRSRPCPCRRAISALMVAKTSDHGPHSKEINRYGGTKGPLESDSKLEPSFVCALEEAVSKGDLFVVVSW